MGTTIRPTVSKKNIYHLDKHRYYELKHFCLQYNEWKKAYMILGDTILQSTNFERVVDDNNEPDNPTEKIVAKRLCYLERIELIEKTAYDTDEYLAKYILQAVTEGYTYTYFKSTLEIPCGKDMYYDRYRKFFWLLDKARK